MGGIFIGGLNSIYAMFRYPNVFKNLTVLSYLICHSVKESREIVKRKKLVMKIECEIKKIIAFLHN